MSAIITDQFRILNASTFLENVAGAGNTNIFYTFIGLSNPTNVVSGGSTDWNTNVPNPLDSFDNENESRPTIISLKKINSGDVTRVIRKLKWEAGRTYEMYKHNYTINYRTPITDSSSLYDANYVVINSNYKVYICLKNGQEPANPKGKPSVDEPDFTDLDPQEAGTSGDGYIWKYLYTLSPSEIIKYDSVNYIPVPNNWGQSGESLDIKENAVDGEIKIVNILSSGVGYTPNTVWSNVPILGDGDGAEVTITVGSNGRVENVIVTKNGSGYTRGVLSFSPNGPKTGSGEPLNGLTNTGVGTTAIARFEVIIPPKGGHGYDIYRELGSNRVMFFSSFQNSSDNPDFLSGNDFARIGIIKNPTIFGSQTQLQTQAVASGVGAIKFANNILTTEYDADTLISQTVGVGSTAYGFVVSHDQSTGVLKYYQPIGLASSEYNYKIHKFTATPGVGGTTFISGATVGSDLGIQTSFTGVSTDINNKTYSLGLSFINGVANPDIDPKSGDIVYVDQIVSVPRSPQQSEDIRIVVEF